MYRTHNQFNSHRIMNRLSYTFIMIIVCSLFLNFISILSFFIQYSLLLLPINECKFFFSLLKRIMLLFLAAISLNQFYCYGFPVIFCQKNWFIKKKESIHLQRHVIVFTVAQTFYLKFFVLYRFLLLRCQQIVSE